MIPFRLDWRVERSLPRQEIHGLLYQRQDSQHLAGKVFARFRSEFLNLCRESQEKGTLLLYQLQSLIVSIRKALDFCDKANPGTRDRLLKLVKPNTANILAGEDSKSESSSDNEAYESSQELRYSKI